MEKEQQTHYVDGNRKKWPKRRTDGINVPKKSAFVIRGSQFIWTVANGNLLLLLLFSINLFKWSKESSEWLKFQNIWNSTTKKNPSLKWVRMKQCDIELNVRVGGELYLYSVYPSTTCFFGIEISRCILLFRIENSLHSYSSRSRAHNMWAHNAPIPSVHRTECQLI